MECLLSHTHFEIDSETDAWVEWRARGALMHITRDIELNNSIPGGGKGGGRVRVGRVERAEKSHTHCKSIFQIIIKRTTRAATSEDVEQGAPGNY